MCTNCALDAVNHVYCVYYIERHRIDKHESSRWSGKTTGQGSSIALTCSPHSLDAERVACTENTFLFQKQTRMEQTHCQGPTGSTRSSRHEQFHRSVKVPSIVFPPPSYQQRLHVIFTALVARLHFWFWHITTRVLVFASASRILWSICPWPEVHVQASGTASRHRRDSVVQLSIGHPMGFTPGCARFFDDVCVVSRTSFHLGLRKNDNIRHDIFFFVIPSAS